MAEHYTRNTVRADAWCAPCGKITPHRIDGVKRGPCLICTGKLEQRREAYEERAAIKEFCGNMTRAQAEQEAKEEIYGQKAERQEGLKF